MSAPPAVSVVLIFHDDVRFLGAAIDSVRAQTFQDWELVLADDGSTDGSTELAQRRAAAAPDRIRYVAHRGHANRGISATRNLGIAQTRGELVAFLDSDDVWLPDKLAEQTQLLAEHPEVGLLFGASLYWWSWDPDGGGREDRLMRIGAPAEQVHEPPALLHHLYPLGDGVSPCPSSCIARREVLQRLGGFEEHMPGLFDDQGFLTKAYLDTPVWVSSRCWDRYRRHAGAVTLATSAAEQREARRYFLDWYEGYLEGRGVEDRAVHAALRRARWPDRHPHLAAARRRAGTAVARVRAGARRRLRRVQR